MPIILTKKSDTASAVPLAADLTNNAGGAELAVNATDKRLFSKTSGGSVVELGTNPSSLTMPNGTANGLAFLNASKVVTSGSALTFDGTTLATASFQATSSTASLIRNADNSYITISGATTYANGAALLLSGNGYAAASQAFLDANQSIFRSAGGGTEYMRLTSTGLGIGTSSPATKLQVYGGALTVGDEATYSARFSNNSNKGVVIGYDTTNNVGHIGSINPATAWTNLVINANGGNLGLGVTPSAWGGSYKALQVAATGAFASNGSNGTAVAHNAFYDGTNDKYLTTGAASRVFQFNGGIRFDLAASGTAGNAITFTQAMTLDSSGNLLVGTTSGVARLTVVESSNLSEADAHFEIIGNGYSAFAWLDGTAYYIGQNSASRSLRIYSSDETAGVNLAAGGTSWGTFSDERLKYDIEPITDGLTKLANVRCVSYRLKDVDAEDSQKKLGVIAQDLVGVVDEVIDITKRSNDDTEYMSVRYTELVPVLIKAIQEQQAIINQLKARLDAANL